MFFSLVDTFHRHFPPVPIATPGNGLSMGAEKFFPSMMFSDASSSEALRSQAGSNIAGDALSVFLEEAKAGSHSAFEALYNALVRDIYKYCLLRIPAEQLEDTVSDVFVKVWQKLPSFQGSESAQFRAWVLRIAHNKIIDLYRSRKEIVRLDDTFEIPESRCEYNPEHTTEDNITVDRVLRAMQHLSPKHQEVLTLKYFQDIPSEDIARVMGTSEGNVRIMLHRALKEVRSHMDDYAE